MSKAEEYTKKPVTIEAVQWDGTVEHASDVLDWILTGEHGASYTEAYDAYDGPEGSYPASPRCIQINTLEGTMNVLPNDWIIKGAAGEFYPCRADIFEQTYSVAGILDTPMQPNDADADTIRDYLKALLELVWEYGEDVIKRPFGNSGWQHEVYEALVRSEVVAGTIEDDCLEEVDSIKAHESIMKAIKNL